MWFIPKGDQTVTVTKTSPEREERRRRQKDLADQLKASGALDGIFAKIDAGEPLTGEGGLLGGMLKAALERGLETELTDHVGYERGAQDASLFPNSRNGTSIKTVATEVGDVELAVPRDRNGTFTGPFPVWWTLVRFAVPDRVKGS